MHVHDSTVGQFIKRHRGMRIRGDAASAMLDHSSETPGQQEFREAAIKRLAYNQSQRLALKCVAVEAWTTAVLDAV